MSEPINVSGWLDFWRGRSEISDLVLVVMKGTDVVPGTAITFEQILEVKRLLDVNDLDQAK